MKPRLGNRGGGQALAEFAIVVPLLLVLLMIVFDFGRALYSYNTLGNAARAGMRTAVVHQDEAAIQAKTLAAVVGVGPGPVVVEFTPCASPEIGCLATVRVSSTWSAITPIIGSLIGSIELAAESTMPIERVNESP